MPAHPKAFARLAERIRTDREHADRYLDEWYDTSQLATEWDADEWGFDPTRWCEKERAELLNRANGETWPVEQHRLKATAGRR